MESSPSNPTLQRSSWKKPILITLAVIVACCGVTAAATGWWIKSNLYASAHSPVTLSANEQQTLETKLATMEAAGSGIAERPLDERDLAISEKEVNAFLAQQGIGEQLKVDFGSDTISANLLLPIDKDAPIFAGTTLRLKLSLSARMDATGKLVLAVNDVRIGGVPMPNAWLGDIKGVDLIASNLGSEPTLQRFAAGIEQFKVEDHGIRIRLSE